MTTRTSRLVELTSLIASKTTALEEYYTSQGLPLPSFDANNPTNFGFPVELEQVRNAVIEAASELQALMLGPAGLIHRYTLDHTNLIALHAIYRYNIASHVAIDGQISYADLSRSCGLDEPDLKRILRYAMTKHVFHEPQKGMVAHTAPSKVLTEIPFENDWVGMVCEEMWPSAVKGFALANNSRDAIFTEIGKDPSRARRFANAMNVINAKAGYGPQYLIQAFPWQDLGIELFVDVGGSYGSTAVAIALAVDTVHCIVQDLPEVTVNGPSNIPQALLGRVDFIAHDFFTEQPVKGADVYYFRWIFHDWSDKYCIKILQNLIPALKTGARIVISEFIVPSPKEVSLDQEWLARYAK
ncbi:MAG: hypothetical protein Q9166_008201 [cf. Caloplaca sp. 2 TL-2023]